MNGSHGDAARPARRGPRPTVPDLAAGLESLLRFPGDHPSTGTSDADDADPRFADVRPRQLPRQRDRPVDP